MQIIEQRLSDECGCPEEELIIGMLVVIIHMEPDGKGHIFLDGGDWGEVDKTVECAGIENLRQQACDWVKEIGIDNNA